MDGSQTSFSFQGLTNNSSQTVLNPHLLKCTALKSCFTRNFSFPFSRIFLQVGLRRKLEAGSDLRHRSSPGSLGHRTLRTEAGGQNIWHRGRDPRGWWGLHRAAGLHCRALGQRDGNPRQDSHPQLQSHRRGKQVTSSRLSSFLFIKMSSLIFKADAPPIIWISN